MYVIIATGGKQYKAEVGTELFVEKLNGEVGDKVELQALALFDGDKTLLGDDANSVKVEAEIVKQGKGKKVLVMKYKPKKNYRRKNGHRQPYTRVRISNIG